MILNTHLGGHKLSNEQVESQYEEEDEQFLEGEGEDDEINQL
jgi:hypothetical protein